MYLSAQLIDWAWMYNKDVSTTARYVENFHSFYRNSTFVWNIVNFMVYPIITKFNTIAVTHCRKWASIWECAVFFWMGGMLRDCVRGSSKEKENSGVDYLKIKVLICVLIENTNMPAQSIWKRRLSSWAQAHFLPNSSSVSKLFPIL